MLSNVEWQSIFRHVDLHFYFDGLCSLLAVYAVILLNFLRWVKDNKGMPLC